MNIYIYTVCIFIKSSGPVLKGLAGVRLHSDRMERSRSSEVSHHHTAEQIKFPHTSVIGFPHSGFVQRGERISSQGRVPVSPPYWQIKRLNPFFIINPFPYHTIMKIQIPPLLSDIKSGP